MQIYSAMIPVKETFSKKEFVRLLLEWNQGSHFKEPDIRTAKAFAWVMAEDHRVQNFSLVMDGFVKKQWYNNVKYS